MMCMAARGAGVFFAGKAPLFIDGPHSLDCRYLLIHPFSNKDRTFYKPANHTICALAETAA